MGTTNCATEIAKNTVKPQRYNDILCHSLQVITMYFKHRKGNAVCLLLGVVLLITLDLVGYLHAVPRILSRNAVDTESPQPHREPTTGVDCSNVLQHGLHELVTPTTFKSMFRGCANITDMSRDSFNSVFMSTTFTDVVCQPREITFLKTRKPKIVLSSYTGSGNTWTRHLLEQLTGVWTGSVYNDDKQLNKVFLGEELCPTSNKTFIIKSHSWGSTLTNLKMPCIKTGIEDYDTKVRHFDAAILLIRNPYDALLSEFNRRYCGGHTGAPNRTLLTVNTTEWREFVFVQSVRWKKSINHRLVEFTGPVHVVFYENLKSCPAYELYRLSVFLETPVTYKTLWCTMERGHGKFQREKPEWLTHSNLYTRDMRHAVDQEIKAVETVLKTKHVASNCVGPYRMKLEK